MGNPPQGRMARCLRNAALVLGFGGLLSVLPVGSSLAGDDDPEVAGGIHFLPRDEVNRRQPVTRGTATSARARADRNRQGIDPDTDNINNTVDGLVNGILDSNGIPRDSGSASSQALERANRTRTQGTAANHNIETVQKVLESSVYTTPNGGKMVVKKVQLGNGQVMETKTLIQKSVQTVSGKGAKACSSIGGLGDNQGDCSQ
ncbi:MAG: hypothetical protein HQL65_12675 [Magnetococcales bacterium]|nr:hypothetical protein [Magnetococcales bacterium]